MSGEVIGLGATPKEVLELALAEFEQGRVQEVVVLKTRIEEGKTFLTIDTSRQLNRDTLWALEEGKLRIMGVRK